MGAPGCRAIARAARHSALRGLNLTANALGDDFAVFHGGGGGGGGGGGLKSASPRAGGLTPAAMSLHDAARTIAGAGDAKGGDELLEQLMLAVGKLANLERLSLEHNNLRHGELLSPVGQMANLQRLNLSHNKLAALPESIGQLRSLVDLAVHNNGLIELPASIGRLSALERLTAQNNALAFLPESFGTCSTSSVLDPAASGCHRLLLLACPSLLLGVHAAPCLPIAACSPTRPP